MEQPAIDPDKETDHPVSMPQRLVRFDRRLDVVRQRAFIGSAVFLEQFRPCLFDQFRLFHRTDSGERHDLSGADHPFESDRRAGKSRILPGMSDISEAGCGNIQFHCRSRLTDVTHIR